MVAPSAGDVVLIPFPFSDLSRSKLRPAVVLAACGRGDWILCQVTSNPYSGPRAVMIADDDFEDGSLQRKSYARPGKLFTASEQLMVRRAGALRAPAVVSIVDEIVSLLRGTR